MRYTFYIVFNLLLSIGLLAQEEKIIEQHFALPQGKKLELDLKFGSDIMIDTWDKKEVNFRAIISYNEPGIEKVHTIDIEETDNFLSITTDYDFDAQEPSSWDCNQHNPNYYNKDRYCIKVRYELILPVNAKVKLETIAGNIEVKDFRVKLD